MATRGRWRRVVLWALGALALAAGAASLWLAVNGRELLWGLMRPDHARILAGVEIPADVAPEAWREDLDWLLAELPRRVVRFDQHVDREAFAAAGAALRPGLGEAGRARAIFDLMRVAALPAPGYGHTGITPLQRPLDWRLYPLRAFLFDDGLWVTLAGAGAEEAQGAEILAIGGRPIAELLAAAAPHVPADNESGRQEMLAGVVSFAEMLQALGAVGEDGVAEMTLRRPGGEPFLLRVAPVRMASFGGLRWGRTMHLPIAAGSPADPRPRERPFGFDYDAETGLLHLRLDAMDDADDETLADFVARVGRFADANPVARFVVDLRTNSGGNNELARPLVELLEGHPTLDRRGVLFTLIGRRTFSAAANLASALEHRTRTLFAGEPSGARPNHFGDAVSLPLPRSKILVQVSTRSWEDGGPYDRRSAIAPQLPVRFTHADHASGRDPALAAVLAYRPEEPPPAAPLAPETAAALAGRYRFSPHHVLTIAEDEGGLALTIDGADRFVTTRLRPLPGGERFATHLGGVVLERVRDGVGKGDLRIDWRGAPVPLARVADDYRLPIELLREDRIAEGLAAFRRLAAAGQVPDSWTEVAINGLGYRLLGEDRVSDAVALFTLQAELYPGVANSFDSLGDGLRRAGESARAAAAYRHALALDPGFAHSRRMLDELAAAAGERGASTE